jgi:hypothetical protein
MESMHIMDGATYFIGAVIYPNKLFMKSTTGRSTEKQDEVRMAS